MRLLRLTGEGAALRLGLSARVAESSTVTARLDAADRETLAELLTKLLA